MEKSQEYEQGGAAGTVESLNFLVHFYRKSCILRQLKKSLAEFLGFKLYSLRNYIPEIYSQIMSLIILRKTKF